MLALAALAAFALTGPDASAQSSFAGTRADLHEKIDARQAVIDGFDGLENRRAGLQNPHDDELASEAFFTLVDLLQTSVESSKQSNLGKYNDLVGVYNLIAEINTRNVAFAAYHHQAIYNAYGLLTHKSLGTLDRFLYRHMLPSLTNTVLFKDEPLAPEFLKAAAETYPAEVLKAFPAYQKEPYAREVLEHTVRIAPNAVKKYFPTRSYINTLLLESDDETVRLVMDVFRKYGVESKAYFFLDKIAEAPHRAGYFSYLRPGTETYLRELIDVRRNPDPLGRHSLEQELEIEALRYVRAINDMHLMKDATERFASVDSMDAGMLYTLLVYSAEEIFTSTYNGIFDRLMVRLEADSLSGYDLLENLGFTRFRTFVKLAAGYNTLARFLDGIPAERQDELFARFTAGLGDERADLGEAVNVADTFGSLEDTAQLRRFSGYLLREYESQRQAMNLHGEVIYSLLISLLGEKIDLGQAAAGVETFELPPLDAIGFEALNAGDLGNIQQHFFFDDEDGLLSYSTFVNNYRNSSWEIADSTHYIVIHSRTGNPVRIFANKPLSEREGQRAIADYFARNGLTPSIVVHRGHSYYVHLTINQVQPGTRMVFLGSCGGYHNLAQVIDRSPDVHIISSKQIGTFLVNNPLLYAISESIRKGEDIKWADLWAQVERKIANQQKAMDKFRDYIPPHKNLGAIFLQAYYSLTG